MQKSLKRYFPVFAFPTLAAFTIGCKIYRIWKLYKNTFRPNVSSFAVVYSSLYNCVYDTD